MEVFAQHGYDAASMRQIAHAAGGSTPVIYDHFGSKQQLHIELLNHQAGELIAYSTSSVPGESFAQLTRRNIDAYFRYVEAVVVKSSETGCVYWMGWGWSVGWLIQVTSGSFGARGRRVKR